MGWRKLWIIAWRDLGRNRRRSGLTLLAVALGLGLLIMMNGLVAGVLQDTLQNGIRLSTGHVQLRAESYDEESASLLSGDLLGNLDDLLGQVRARKEVQAVTPVLWANGLLNTPDESLALRIVGIDPDSPVHRAIREAVTAGDYLTADDRDGVLLGTRLADTIGVGVAGKVELTVVDADGNADSGLFTVRGLVSTDVPTYDESAVLMPLSKAQAFTGAEGKASAIVLLLYDEDDARRVADALTGGGITALTYKDLNGVLVQAIETGMNFYIILDLIVMLVVAVIIVNTLLMAVFERVREVGILTALGMRARQVLVLFLLEGAALALAGIALGLVLGLLSVAYLVKVGIPLGEMASVAGSIALGTTMYGRFDGPTFAGLSLGMLAIILLGSLYPAWYASRLEPATALHRT